MKRPKYLTENNAYLLEPGDRLHFKATERMLEHSQFSIPFWEGPAEFDITVRGLFLNSIHGARIYSDEKIGPNEEDDFYLRDDWEITIIYPEEQHEVH